MINLGDYMVELNKEIINAIKKLDCDDKMKYFLREVVEMELEMEEMNGTHHKKKKETMKLIERYC